MEDLTEILLMCAYMNEASTSISMELIPNEQPIICETSSFDYGDWISGYGTSWWDDE